MTAQDRPKPGPARHRPLPAEIDTPDVEADAPVDDTGTGGRGAARSAHRGRSVRRWWSDAALPLPTLITFAVFAVVVWLNAAVNHYRFNVAIAVLASVPLLVVTARGALTARALRHRHG